MLAAPANTATPGAAATAASSAVKRPPGFGAGRPLLFGATTAPRTPAPPVHEDARSRSPVDGAPTALLASRSERVRGGAAVAATLSILPIDKAGAALATGAGAATPVPPADGFPANSRRPRPAESTFTPRPAAPGFAAAAGWPSSALGSAAGMATPIVAVPAAAAAAYPATTERPAFGVASLLSRSARRGVGAGAMTPAPRSSLAAAPASVPPELPADVLAMMSPSKLPAVPAALLFSPGTPDAANGRGAGAGGGAGVGTDAGAGAGVGGGEADYGLHWVTLFGFGPAYRGSVIAAVEAAVGTPALQTVVGPHTVMLGWSHAGHRDAAVALNGRADLVDVEGSPLGVAVGAAQDALALSRRARDTASAVATPAPRPTADAIGLAATASYAPTPADAGAASTATTTPARALTRAPEPYVSTTPYHAGGAATLVHRRPPPRADGGAVARAAGTSTSLFRTPGPNGDSRPAGGVVAAVATPAVGVAPAQRAVAGVESDGDKPLFRQPPTRRRNWCGRLCNLLFSC